MKNVQTLSELLEQLEQVQASLDHASDLIHDTGDFESKELDEATTSIDRARDLIRSAYEKF